MGGNRHFVAKSAYSSKIETPMANLHPKFEVYSFNRSRDMKVFQNSKSSRDPFMTPFDQVLHFSSVMPHVVNLSVKFDANVVIRG